MCQALPVGEFNFVNETIERVLKTPDDACYGFYLDVNLEYPEEIHELTRDFPLAPHHYTITESDLSLFQKEQIKKLNLKIGKTAKLIATCWPRNNYVI